MNKSVSQRTNLFAKNCGRNELGKSDLGGSELGRSKLGLARPNGGEISPEDIGVH